MSEPALRLIHGGRPADPPCAHTPHVAAMAESRNPAGCTAQPYWWRWAVIQCLRHGNWLFPLPPLWAGHRILRALRSWSIRRAMQAMKGELGWDGTENFNFIAAFVRVEAGRRRDPRFRATCEHALRIGRITILGLPVILDDEIDDQGQNAFIRHFAWTVSRTREHPLARRLKP